MIEMTDSMWILFFVILFLSYMTENIIYGVFVIFILLFLYKYKTKYIKSFKEFIKEETADNNDLHYNDNIIEKLEKLKKYRKYNINEYNTGLKYLHKCMDNIHKLENRNLKHSRQYLENAKLYLNKSINHFQFITTSISDRNLIHGLKYNDYTSTKKVKKLHKIIDDLYKTIFSILFTISTDREKLFLENPDIYKGHVEFVEPEPSNNVNLHELY